MDAKEEVADLYSQVASQYGRVGPDFFSQIGQRLVELIGLIEGMSVLDVAAGRGANLFAAAERAGTSGQVIGVDLAEGMVRETTADIVRRGLHNASMLQMDAEQLHFADASFDCVLCSFAVFWFASLERVFAEFFRILHPAGKVGIVVASDGDAVSHWFSARLTAYHEHYAFPLRPAIGRGYDADTLQQMLAQAGFVSSQAVTEDREFIYADAEEWWASRWTHGPSYALKHMPEEPREQLHVEVLAKVAEHMQSDGFHERLHVWYMIGLKS